MFYNLILNKYVNIIKRFSAVVVKDIEGNESTLDISKNLSNQIYRETADLGELEMVREIYKNGVINVENPQQAQILSDFVKKGFVAFVQESLCPVLDKLFDKEKINIK